MKKNVTGYLVVLLVLIALFWSGKAVNSPGLNETDRTEITSTLVASETLYDFGTIRMADGLVSHVFAVNNNSSEDIEIKTINTSCMCTTAYIESIGGEKGPFGMLGMGYVPPANEVIKAGESRNVRVVYDPNAHGPAGVGIIDRFIYLTEKNGSVLELEIKAIVQP